MSPPRPRRRGAAFELRMAVRYLTTRRREGPVAFVTLLCTGGVFVGVFALVLALALMDGLHGDIRARLLASNAHVVVRPAPRAPPYDAADLAAVEGQVLAVRGVVAAAPFRQEWAVLRSAHVPEGRPVSLKGIVPEAEDRVTGLASQATGPGWRLLVEDDARGRARAAAAEDGAASGEAAAEDDDDAPLSFAELRPPAPPALLLGEGLAFDLGVTPGDVVHLVTAGVDLSATGPVPRSRALRVAGLLQTGLGEYDRTWAVGSLASLSRAGALPDAPWLQLALEDPMQAASVADEVAGRLGMGHAVSDWTSDFSRLFAAQKWEKLILFISLGLIGLVAGFNIFTILTLNVTARIADIGVLGALGAGAPAVTRIFLWMGLLLGGAGTLAGIAAGAAAAEALDRWRVVALDPAVYLVTHVPFQVQPADLLAVAAGMVAVSFVATLAPARAAARLDPVVALRSA